MSTLLTPAAIAVMLSLGTHAFAVPYSVANEAELRAALSSGDATTITFTGDIVVTQGGGGDLPAVQGNVTIDGGGHSLSGDGANRGLFVYGDSNVRIQDLTIKDTAATGGAGGARAGGGAGLGGGLFVHSDSNVTLSNVTFEDNAANGGDGGTNSSFDGGGGGLGGDGGQPDETIAGGGGGGVGNQAHGGTGDGSAGGGGIVT
ncbi:MAG: pectate lyase-like adhesive domain-containing protein, partial [Rhizobiaceae bacterium]